MAHAENQNETGNEYEEILQEGEVSEEYVEEDEAAAQQAAEAAAAAKKKRNNKFVMAVAGVAVVVGGGLSAKVFLKKPAQQAPVAVAQEKAVQPLAVAETKPPTAVGVDINAPKQALPVNEPSVQEPVGGITPPQNMNALPGAPGNVLPGMPTTGAPAQVQQPVSNLALPAAGTATPAPIPNEQTEGFARGLAELKDKVDGIYTMFSKFEETDIVGRIGKIESRLDALEAAKSTKSSNVTGDQSAQPARKRTSTGTSSRRESRAENIKEKQLKVEGVADPRQKISLQAVIPGRLWVKLEDGSSQNFATGDNLPDGSKVLKIDAEKGRVVTTKGVLN